MGLRAKFNLVILVAFAIGFAAAAVVLHRVFIDRAREQVMQNARIMMTAANAIRTYTADDLVPLLPMQHDGKFVAETVPAFAAQTNFKDVQAAFAGYTYREPALNPTNPIDRAQDWEADIIREFRNEAHEKELVVERDTPLGRTLNLARPVTAEQPCLLCHSTVAAAPAVLIQTHVSAMADAVSLGDETIEPYIKPGKDEISSLSVSFNRMRESLNHAMAMIK